jgi:hypothetical protein
MEWGHLAYRACTGKQSFTQILLNVLVVIELRLYRSITYNTFQLKSDESLVYRQLWDPGTHDVDRLFPAAIQNCTHGYGSKLVTETPLSCAA